MKPSVAVRAGVASARYRTEDGCMILNEQDMRMTRLEPQEYLTGVVEAVLTESEALLLIQQGGKQMGLPVVEETADATGTEDVPAEETADAVEESTEEEAVESEEPEVEPEEEVTNE